MKARQTMLEAEVRRAWESSGQSVGTDADADQGSSDRTTAARQTPTTLARTSRVQGRPGRSVRGSAQARDSAEFSGARGRLPCNSISSVPVIDGVRQ